MGSATIDELLLDGVHSDPTGPFDPKVVDHKLAAQVDEIERIRVAQWLLDKERAEADAVRYGLPDLVDCALIDGVVVVEVDHVLPVPVRAMMQQEFSLAWPERRVVILEKGIRIVTAQGQALSRIEGKLDQLLAALANEQEGDDDGNGPQFDLEGNAIGRPRPIGQEL